MTSSTRSTDADAALTPAGASAKPKHARATLVYAAGSALPRALNLLFLPLYTSVLSAAEYGRLSLLLTIGVAASFLFSLGLDTALFRTFFQHEGDGPSQRRYVSSVWLFLLLSSPASALLLGLILLPLTLVTPLIDGVSLILVILGYAAYTIATPVTLSVFRAEERLGAFAIFASVSAVATTAAIAICVAVLDLGVQGWLAGVLVANVALIPLAVVMIPVSRPRPSYDRTGIKSSLKLGIPLIPHYLSHWALQLADRAVLAGLVTASSLGIYSLASNIAVPGLVFVQAVSQSLMPSYAKAGQSREQHRDLGRTMFYQVVAVVGGCAVLAFLLPPAAELVSPSTYSGAGTLIPWLILGYAFLGVYYLPVNIVTLVYGKSNRLWMLSITCAIGNVLLIIVATPQWGLRAAAAASAVAYCALFFGMLIYTRRVGRTSTPLDLQFPWHEAAAVTAAVVACYAVGTTVTGSSTAVDLVERFAIVAAVAATSQLAPSLRVIRRPARPQT